VAFNGTTFIPNFIKIHPEVLKFKMHIFYKQGRCSSWVCCWITGRLMPHVLKHHGGSKPWSTNHPITQCHIPKNWNFNCTITKD